MQLVSAVLIVSAMALGGPNGPEQTKTPETLAQVMRSIHRQLVSARHQFPWLFDYTSQCLSENPSAILYMPRTHRPFTDKPQPQKPDQMGLGFVPLNTKRAFKAFNLFERFPQCKFKRYGLKLSGDVIDWD